MKDVKSIPFGLIVKELDFDPVKQVERNFVNLVFNTSNARSLRG